MHRSASANRIWDSQLSYYHHHRRHHSDDVELPMYDPFSDAAKKEKAVARFAGNAVHVIPFLLLFCAFLLWFFSNSTDINVEGSFLVAKIQRQRNTIEADLDSDGIGHFPLDLEDLDPFELQHSKLSLSDNKRPE